MNRSSNSSAGLVLIELLIAVTIAALIIGVILIVYISVLNTVSLQNRWRAKSLPAAEALDFIARDMRCLAVPCGTSPVFTAAFSNGVRENFEMCFYSAFPSVTSNAWRYGLARVFYTWQSTGTVGEFVLSRKVFPFRVPSGLSGGREEWRGIKKMEISFYDGMNWTNQWDPEKGSNCAPQAAHIKLVTESAGQPFLETEVFINAGRRIAAPKAQ